MPPPRTKKMTEQPVRVRHFPGKPGAAEVEEPSSDEDSESEKEEVKPKPWMKPRPAPLASSFPKSALKSKLALRQKSDAERKQLENEFETESEAESAKAGSESENASGSGSGSDAEAESSEEESSSEDEAPKLLRPVFLKKNQRNKIIAPEQTADEVAAEDERRRKEQQRAVVQDQVEQRAAEKAMGKKDWDDDVEEEDINAIDDTDGVDPKAEYAAWKLRELKRIKRERLAIEEAEAELAQLERRRGLSAAEREAEDREFLKKQEEERGERGDMQFMQKYHHKGAFYQEDMKELGVHQRKLMSARFEDATDREVLPEYMQIRDMTKLGKKGRTKYRDMKTEDTGQWGQYKDDFWKGRPDKNDSGLDERFRSDGHGRGGRDGEGATGANAKPLGDRKRFGEENDREGKRPRLDIHG
ncbi:splicing factor, Prp19-binding domain-containing protein [Massariosphaeria phaeospora]|uniref:Splicing factor, Prp19-binding domain-containing protein n=1 Tax=Massariosphaeria phaeospora TaxID=100035 RepID=A0A7C8M0V0_9PLEO|nr:splicing factor, Prp19-binding domain-containing protein [Massariosphaeria phaeospora]